MTKVAVLKDNKNPLSHTPGKLRQRYGDSPTQRRLYAAVVDGHIPVTYRNGRIYVDDADLPLIAAMFGLTEPAQAVAEAPRARDRRNVELRHVKVCPEGSWDIIEMYPNR